MRSTRLTARLTLALLWLAAGRPAHAAWPNNNLVNAPLAVAAGDQVQPASVPDGNGGAYVAWIDGRNSLTTGLDVYGTHVDRRGNVVAGWPANGLAICTAAGDASALQGIDDGAGGVIWCWQDARGATPNFYGAHLLANGVAAAGWPANGLMITNLGASSAPSLCADGAGGGWLAYQYAYSGTDNDLYVSHFQGNGSLGSITNYPVSTLGASFGEEAPSVTTDGAGGCFMAYLGKPSGSNFDIYVARVTSSGSVTTSRLSTSSTDQTQAIARYDGFQGFFVEWTGVEPSKGTDVWLTRVMPNLAADPSWIYGNRFEVYASPDANSFGYAQDLVADGAGGVYAGFRQVSTFILGSSAVALIRVGPHGVLPAGWPAAGFSWTAGFVVGYGANMKLASDGVGGVLATFELADDASGPDVCAQHLTANGSAYSGWPDVSSYLIVGGATNEQSQASMSPDGAGGALVFYRNKYNGTDFDIYGQRVERFGRFGLPAPKITAVRDVPGDQGGHVRVSWNASYLDGDPYAAVTQYRIWRQAPAALAQAALRAGAAHLDSDAPSDPVAVRAGRVFRVTRDAAQAYYWEQIATQSAAGYPGYSLVAATTSDSIGGGNPRTVFMVDATNYGSQYWSSDPDSGYSVDNLPPVAPAPFTGNYVAGHGTILQWQPNAESDLADYELFRGGNAAFPADNAHLVTRTTQASFDDAGSGPAWYKLRACDVHGNCSALVTLLPGGTAAVGDEVPASLAFTLGSGNPSRGVATLRLALPRASAVAIDILDAQGRRVRALTAGERPAGTYAIRWDGADEHGHAAASGLYFARLTAGGETRMQRLVRID